jgi:hypothetical protein
VTDRPSGRRFSQVYLDPGQPVYESRRLQHRAASFFENQFSDEARVVLARLEFEIGLSIPGTGYSEDRIKDFLQTCSTEIFLDAVTVIKWALSDMDRQTRWVKRRGVQWVTFLKRAFTEQNSKFEVDDEGGCHPRIDSEFTVQKVATLKELGKPRYAVVREHFDQVHAALDELPPATNRAIREAYLANEEALKLLCPKSTFELKSLPASLGPIIQQLYGGPELNALRLMIVSAGNYAVASHQYRHAQGMPDQPPASMESAALMISTGTSVLRWLLALDQAQLESASEAAEPTSAPAE